MRKVIATTLILLCFVLQSTIFRSLSFAGIGPNLMIILTAAYGFMRGEKEGLLIGFFCGFLKDIFFGDVLGFYALLYMYLGFLNGKFNMIFYPEDIKLPIALISVSNMSYGVICYILLFLLRGRLDFRYYFSSIIFPEVIYTIVVTMLLYPVILKINDKLERFEKKHSRGFQS